MKQKHIEFITKELNSIEDFKRTLLSYGKTNKEVLDIINDEQTLQNIETREEGYANLLEYLKGE